MKNLRWVTPSLVTVAVALLIYIANDVKASREYMDKVMDQHKERPHVTSATRFRELTQEINGLKIEVRLLRR